MLQVHLTITYGLSERNVQTMKIILQKSLETRTNPHLALLCYQTTPLSNDIVSPLELLTGRSFKANQPRVKKPRPEDLRTAKELQDRQAVQKQQYDRRWSVKSLTEFTQQEPIQAFNPRLRVWEQAVVLQRASDPRSYIIKTCNGSVFRINRYHLRTTGERPR